MKRILKMIGLSLLGIIFLGIIGVVLFMTFSPQFGSSLSKEQKAAFSQLQNFKNGKFQNQQPSPMDMDFRKVFKEMVNKSPYRKPHENIAVQKIDSASISSLNAETTRLTWFGHATFLLEMDGKKILIDPMLSKSPSPVSFAGSKRFSDEIPIEASNLPFIDAVILSHDHYDHLDYKTIKQLKNKVGQFYAPLGVGNHLESWGVDASIIYELNWGDSIQHDHINLVCAPARHFSGRGFFDRATTLWCSWIIQGKKDNIFFSGDSGYGIHYKEIGDQYGPFDISLLECGQYNENWKHLHMMPEGTAQAAVDLKSKLMMPIHWGAFTLAFHDWADPVERALAKAKELNMPITTPEIGEPVVLGEKYFPNEKWWTKYIIQ
ncbi:MBL fold metallo-hydrolase [Salinivirga cyanobacteriivorans]|nr:MBL fold metallo-hydrolase [Salinivirga cyanobacteriivorans]